MARYDKDLSRQAKEQLQKFLLKKDIKCRIKNNKVLITGMMRGSRKTTTAFDFLLQQDFLYKIDGVKIVYVTKIIGKIDGDEIIGTFNDTVDTIRRIESDINLDADKLRICMYAGINKICQKAIDLEQSGDKNKKFKEIMLCKNCKAKSNIITKFDDIPQKLINELESLDTLTPIDSKRLALKHNTCPRIIQQYYADKCADILLLSYAMYRLKGTQLGDNYPFIIFDEARHIIEMEDEKLVTIRSKTKPYYKDIIKKIDKKYILRRYLNKPDAPDWYDELEYYIQTFGLFIRTKLTALNKSHIRAIRERENGYEDKQGKYIEEDLKTQFEYKPMGRDYNFVDEYIAGLDSQDIEKKLVKIIQLLASRKTSNEEKRELRKCFSLFETLKDIAGSTFTEIEIIRPGSTRVKTSNYVINIRYGKPFPKISSPLTLLLEGTPFTPLFYRMWLGVTKNELDVVSLPSRTKITIIYENSKKSTNDIYGYGDKSEPLKRHVYTLKEVDKRIKDFGLECKTASRTKDVANRLGSNGIKTDFVCGDTSGEGVQLLTDVLVLEGVQIKNINVGLSRMYHLATTLREKYPISALRIFQNVVNLQTMMQSMFRGIDGSNKRGNFIILLGNKMPYGEQCWVELAKQYWSYLKDRNVRFVEYTPGRKKENDIQAIMEVISNPNYDFEISPYENQIMRYIKSRKNKQVKQATLVKHFTKPANLISKSRPDIFEAIIKLCFIRKLIKTKDDNNNTILSLPE